ncbi:MAG: signal peptidase I [Eubacterium sp.]|nr:signal peptidase I [Eubacterium sp.]
MIGSGEQERERLRKLRNRKGKRLLEEILVTAVLLVLLFTQLIGAACVSGSDMYPTVRDGDLILYFRHGKWRMGDAVVYEADGALRQGRIEGVCGTAIDLAADGQLTFDGVQQPADGRRGLYYQTVLREGDLPQYPLVPAEKQYFLLGDQRETAADSRCFGLIDEAGIKGIVFAVIRRRAI